MQIYDNTGNVDMAINNALIYFDKSDDPDMVAVESICRKHLSYGPGFGANQQSTRKSSLEMVANIHI